MSGFKISVNQSEYKVEHDNKIYAAEHFHVTVGCEVFKE